MDHARIARRKMGQIRLPEGVLALLRAGGWFAHMGRRGTHGLTDLMEAFAI
jgi:hypothetical protein